MGAVKESHRAAFFGVENGLPGTRVRVKLLPVSPAKLLPAAAPPEPREVPFYSVPLQGSITEPGKEVVGPVVPQRKRVPVAH
jgi:hypothetical protein